MDAYWYVTAPGGDVVARVDVEEWQTADRHIPAEILAAAGAPGRGYNVCWASIPPLRKQWSREARARNRIRRLRERMERKYPLFAEMFIQEALEARPDYYAGCDPIYDKDRPE